MFYRPIMDGRYRAMPGNKVMRTTTAIMAKRKGTDPWKMVNFGTSFTTQARV